MKRKLLVFLFLSLCLSVPVSAAKVNDSQQRITVQLNDASIRELFVAIKKQADVNFMYSNNLVNQLPYKDYNFKDSSLENILSYCLEDTDLQYEIVNNTIVIKKKSGRNEITGRVVDSEGLPLAGVTIFEKGTSRGTATNINGEFRLATERNTGVKLIASFLGMKQQELAWSGKPLNILMEDEFKQINEVVVTGYQIIDKRSLTSAVTTLKPSEIMRADVMSIDQMLEGQVPDLIFTSNSGEVGVVPRLRIRGTSTLIGNREPLWVIDGIVMQDPINVSAEELNDPDYVNRIGNAIAGINPQDIERIDVLKDAAATALYGTKAANGVIVVTTKRGHEGKPQVSYNMGLTYKLRPRYTDRSIDLMNSKERIQFSRELLSGHYKYDNTINMVGYEGLLNDLYNGKINNAEFGRQVSALETLNTDWFDLLTRDSFSNQHTISLSGGSGTSRYYTSIGFVNNEDVIKDNYNKRYTATLNIDNQINKWLMAAFSIKGNVNDRKYYQDEIAPMDYAYSTARTIPAYAQRIILTTIVYVC